LRKVSCPGQFTCPVASRRIFNVEARIRARLGKFVCREIGLGDPVANLPYIMRFAAGLTAVAFEESQADH